MESTSYSCDVCAGVVPDRRLREMCYVVLDDPRFGIAPAAKKYHHAYAGGLAVHTAEVHRMAIAMSVGTQFALLTVAAIWHDYLKVEEYEVVKGEDGPEYGSTRFADLIYHPAGGYAEFLVLARRLDVDALTVQEIGHCILSHHGRQEWGAPVEPKTEAAWFLHSADMWSSRFGPGRFLVEAAQ
jgi:3'-5' exoribonuclease